MNHQAEYLEEELRKALAEIEELRGPNSIIEFVPDIDQEAMTSIHSASMVVMPLRQ